MARTFEELVELFNDRPLEGMRNLTQEGFVGNSPDDIATFLRTNKSLRKKNIGEFLTETSPENLQAFVEQFDFANVDFVEALRTFLYSFILPGEAQKIDRLMEPFANAYYTQNQNSPTNHFVDADSCYILAFSIIMLNTDATAPMIKRKMTSSEFVRGLIGINAGGDLPQDFTEHVYDTVHREPFEIRDTPLGESKKRGYLQKKGFLFLKKKLWFMVTTDSRLYYFKDEIDGYNHKPMGYFDLENVNVETSCSGNNFIIEISPTEGQTSLKEFQMDNNNEPQEETCPKLVLTASSMDEMEDWCESLVGNYKATRASNNFKSARK